MKDFHRKYAEFFDKIFPDVIATTNFWLMWVFLLVMLSSIKEPLIVLVSSLGAVVCLNEWARRVLED